MFTIDVCTSIERNTHTNTFMWYNLDIYMQFLEMFVSSSLDGEAVFKAFHHKCH